jgi:hypothetical protein
VTTSRAGNPIVYATTTMGVSITARTEKTHDNKT